MRWDHFFLMYIYINVQCLYFYGALQFVSEMVNKNKFSLSFVIFSLEFFLCVGEYWWGGAAFYTVTWVARGAQTDLAF